MPYYNFGLARAMGAMGVKRVFGVDWWKECAKSALAVQEKDGSWYRGAADDVDVLETCWEVLSLRRACVPGK